MRKFEGMKKVLSALLCVLMLTQYVPVTALAVSDDNLCEHHMEHSTEVCGYVEAVEGQPCTHTHDTAVCGYVEAVQEVPCECTETDESGALVHTEGCGYVAPVAGSDCTHVHDDTCGYAAGVEAKPCTYECADCTSKPTCICDTACIDFAGTNWACTVCAEDFGACVQAIPTCYCAVKCTEDNFNDSCDICRADYTACGGEGESASYAGDCAHSFTNGACTLCGITGGYCGAQGENLAWTLDAAGTLTICGEGAMAGYSGNSPWYNTRSSITAVVLESGVTTIGSDAFYMCTNLTSITIPEGVTSIGESAFFHCTRLTSVTIPDSVTSIGKAAFSECGSLSSITLSKGIISIGYYAFGACSSLTAIGVDAANATFASVDGVLFTKDLQTLVAFPGGRSGDYTIPEDVTSIGMYAFYKCSGLTSVSIPGSVTRIRSYAFESCSGLTSITIPKGVTVIDMYAFSKCSGLTSITIPGSIASIDRSAFTSCNKLTSVSVPCTWNSDDPLYSFDNQVAVTVRDHDWDSGTCYACGLICEHGNVENNSCTVCGLIFGNCGAAGDNLTWKLTLNADGISYTLTVSGNGEMADYSSNNTPWYAYCDSITAIVLKPGITSIGDGVFDNCTRLTTVSIPCELKEDSQYDFGDGVTITSDHDFENNKCTACSIIGGYCGAASDGKNLIWTLKDGTMTISGSGVMVNYSSSSMPWYAHRGLITSVEIGSGITTIGNNAFNGCLDLTSVTVPGSVISIGSRAFYGCFDLTSITIPGSVTSIGDYAFATCSSLTSITIPGSVTSIGDFAFWSCDSLTSVTISEGVISIGGYAFYECTSLTGVTIPKSVTYIDSDAFAGCSSLTAIEVESGNTVYISKEGVLFTKDLQTIVNFPGGKSGEYTIPDGVTSISSSTFSGCGLTSITIPDSVTYIGSNAFYDCDKLETVNVPCKWDGELLYTFEDNVELNIAAHIGGEATCTQKAECTVCDKPYGEALGHDWLYEAESDTVIKATCQNTAVCPVTGNTVTITLVAPTKTVYGDNGDANATVTQSIANTVADLAVKYSGTKADGTAYTESTTAPTDAGEYKATLTLGEGTNTATAEVTYIINEAAPRWTAPEATNPTYADADLELVSGGSATNGTMYYAVTETTATTAPTDGWSTDVPTGNAAKTYRVWYKVIGDTNYSDITPDYVDSTISKAASSVTEAPTAKELTYNGEDQALVTAGTANGGEMQYSLDNTGWSTSIPTATNAGTYTVYYKVVGDGNHEDAAGGTVSVTIDKAELTVTADNKSMSTGYNLPKLTCSITGFVNGEDRTVLTTQPTAETAADGKTAGTYVISASGAEADNYDFAYVNGTLSVVDHQHVWTFTANADTITAYCGEASCPSPQQSITISAEGKTYDGKPVVAETAGSIEDVADPVISYSGNTNAGTYTASITIEGAKAEAEFTISAATPIITWGSESQTGPYTGEAAEITAPTVKLVNGETFNGTISYSYSGKTVDYKDVSGYGLPTNAGEYIITASIDAQGNYTAATSTNPLTLTITKSQPTIEFNGYAPSKTYDGIAIANPTEAQLTITGAVYTDVTFTWYKDSVDEANKLPAAPKDAGTYYVVASIPESDNTSKSSDTSGAITITAKTVSNPTVTLSGGPFTYNGSEHTPTVTVKDGETTIPDSEYTVTYDNNTEVGAVTVAIKNVTGGNYVISEGTKGVFLILPDTSALDRITTANVTSDDQQAIDAIQALMDGKNVTGASEGAQAAWKAIADRCTELEAAITNAATKSAEIIKDTADLPAQPKTSDLETIEGILDEYDSIKNNLTEEEKADLADAIEKLEDLKEAITETKADLKEITDGTTALDNKDDLVFADKATIQDLQDKIEELEDNAYLTDADKQALEDAEETLEELKAEFAEAEKAEEAIEDILDDLPYNVQPDDKDAIDAYEDAMKIYEDLKDDQEKMDPKVVERLESLEKALTDYKITKGSGAKWYKGSKKDLSFTANGYHEKCIGVKIDGELIDESNYSISKGSTIVTLKASYLQSLKTDKYTIRVMYSDGETDDGEFTVLWPHTDNPRTGDYIMMAVAVMALSAAALAVLLVLKKKNKK